MLLRKLYDQNKITEQEMITHRLYRFRELRKRQFEAFDLWEKAVIREREEDSQEVMEWYQMMLDYTDTINEETDISGFPKLHPKLEKYRH